MGHRSTRGGKHHSTPANAPVFLGITVDLPPSTRWCATSAYGSASARGACAAAAPAARR